MFHVNRLLLVDLVIRDSYFSVSHIQDIASVQSLIEEMTSTILRAVCNKHCIFLCLRAVFVFNGYCSYADRWIDLSVDGPTNVVRGGGGVLAFLRFLTL